MHLLNIVERRDINWYMRKRRINWKSIDFPEELDPQIPKITILGRGDLLLENHIGVLEYTLEQARLMTGQGMLRVTGEQLQLCELGQDRVYIRGKIDGCTFEE